jgi:hypothetical protein
MTMTSTTGETLNLVFSVRRRPSIPMPQAYETHRMSSTRPGGRSGRATIPSSRPSTSTTGRRATCALALVAAPSCLLPHTV